MTADFWGRLFVTSVLVVGIGLAIFGMSSSENEKYKKSEVGMNLGCFMCVFAALSALISAFGYIWTAQ